MILPLPDVITKHLKVGLSDFRRSAPGCFIGFADCVYDFTYLKSPAVAHESAPEKAEVYGKLRVRFDELVACNGFAAGRVGDTAQPERLAEMAPDIGYRTVGHGIEQIGGGLLDVQVVQSDIDPVQG